MESGSSTMLWIVRILIRVSNLLLNYTQVSLYYLYEKDSNRVLRAAGRISDAQTKLETAYNILEDYNER